MDKTVIDRTSNVKDRHQWKKIVHDAANRCSEDGIIYTFLCVECQVQTKFPSNWTLYLTPVRLPPPGTHDLGYYRYA